VAEQVTAQLQQSSQIRLREKLHLDVLGAQQLDQASQQGVPHWLLLIAHAHDEGLQQVQARH
jgi:hypothetical protein